MTVTGVRNQVKMQKSLSRNFIIEELLSQKDLLSPILFNLALKETVQSIEINPSGNIYNRLVQCMAYADDVVLTTRMPVTMREAFNEIETAAQQMGLEIIQNKIKFMETRRDGQRSVDLDVHDYQFEGVTEFTYLEATLSSIQT